MEIERREQVTTMTDESIFDGFDKPRKKRRKRKPKQSVLWTVYHTILAVELLIIIIIEGIELLR
jgi:hypothetical protein